MARKILSLFTLLLIPLVIYGCGQSLNQTNINSSKASPKGLAVKGTIYVYDKNNLGTQTDPQYAKGKVISGANVLLTGADNSSSFSMTTRSNEKGEYTFQNVPDGRYILVASSEGCQRYRSYPFSFKDMYMAVARPGADERVPDDNTIVTRDIVMSSWPIILSMTPAANSVISTNEVFTFTFNEAINGDTIFAEIHALGPRMLETNKLTDSNCGVSLSPDKKTLTLTPKNSLNPNMQYVVLLLVQDLDGYPNRIGMNIHGTAWENTPVETGDQAIMPMAIVSGLPVYNSIYRTSASGAPSAPSNLQLNCSDSNEVDFIRFFSGGGSDSIRLSWSPSSSGNITGYKVYVSKAGTSTYSLLADSTGADWTTNTYFTTDFIKVLFALFMDASQIDAYAGTCPFENYPVSFKVVAFNGDGESGSATLSVTDTVGPKIYDDSLMPIPPKVIYEGLAISSVLPDFKWLPAIDDPNDAYVILIGPVDKNSVSPACFSITRGGVPINTLSAEYITSISTYLNLISIVKVKASAALNTNPLAYSITISGLKDVAGNAVKTGSGDTYNWNP